MSRGPTIETERLVLRRWEQTDLEPFAALNADPVVMEHFPAVMTEADTVGFIDWIELGFERNGFGLWAVEVSETGALAGFTGLSVPAFEAHFTPAVEVGWRLAREHWDHGYATEAARAAMTFGFEECGLAEIVSFAIPANTRSISVMERLGMAHDPADDFDHPRFPDDDRSRRHVLYRMSSGRWAEIHTG